ncbi:MAG: prephenate dehydrogenase [Verrucomicrobiales bacterium]
MDRIAILGGGLLGGSLALCLEGRANYSLWARREASVDEAQAAGISCATTDLAAAIRAADLIVLTVPVGVMPGLVSRMLEIGLNKDVLVTDVGSVKSPVHRDVGTVLATAGVAFIGGHPMAGSEQRGVSAARRELFEGAACILTDEADVGDPWASALEHFWVEVGCRVSWLSAATHDELVARISHFPHVMASLTAGVALAKPQEACFGGGGLRDTTRVAGGDPEMWTEILMENRDAVAASLREARKSLGDVLAMLERGDHEATLAWLTEAKLRHSQGRQAKKDCSHG